MEDAILAGYGTVHGRLYRISWYPGLVLDSEAGRVHGDLFRVTEEQLLKLDEFEGLAAGEIEGSEYRRIKVPVLRTDGEPEMAWVYEWKGSTSGAVVIPDGDWLKAQAD